MMSGSERGATETADPEVAATTYRRLSAQERSRKVRRSICSQAI